MLSKYLVFLFLPAIVFGQIKIKINAAKREKDASVRFYGRNVAIITDKDRETFKIKERQLKEACLKYAGARPSDVFLKDPTPPWGEVYHKYNWDQVQVTLEPVRARVLGVHTEPVIVSTREFENYSSFNAKYNAGISHQIEQTFSTSWSTGGEMGVEQSISYNVNFATGSLGGSTSFSLTSSWGRETTKSKEVILGSTTNVEVELEPNKAVTASLTANHGTLDIEVDYEARVSGDVFANYPDKLNGHHFWAFNLQEMMEANGLPLYVNSTEKISIGFYTSARVEVTDKDTSSRVIKVAPAGVIGSSGRNRI